MSGEPSTPETPPEYVPLPVVREVLERELEERAKRGEELLKSQEHIRHSLEHARAFSKISPSRARELQKALLALGGRVTPFHATKIVDILPQHPDEVRTIFAKDRITPEPQEIERIIELVRAYSE